MQSNVGNTATNEKKVKTEKKLYEYNAILEKSIFFDRTVDPEDVSFFRTNLTTDYDNDPQGALKRSLSQNGVSAGCTKTDKQRSTVGAPDTSQKENALDGKILQFRKA